MAEAKPVWPREVEGWTLSGVADTETHWQAFYRKPFPPPTRGMRSEVLALAKDLAPAFAPGDVSDFVARTLAERD